MDLDGLERLEEVALSMVVQAITDYKDKARDIFEAESDLPQDIAEDVTREALEEMRLPRIDLRLYGKVDVKKAIYVFLPEAMPAALMLDAKAEKGDERTATIQMAQTSMRVKMRRGGKDVNERGTLEKTIERDGKTLQTVTIIAKYVYKKLDSGYALNKIIVACIPNGQLQERYNPDVDRTIWKAGRNAHTRGEDFRVRLSFVELKKLASWRVNEIPVLAHF